MPVCQRSTMKSGKPLAAIFVLILAQSLFSSFSVGQEKAPVKRDSEARPVLREGWTLQTSAKLEAKGEVISTPQFAPKGWDEATVPTTVVAALVKDNTLADPFPGMNLRSFPGVTYP